MQHFFLFVYCKLLQIAQNNFIIWWNIVRLVLNNSKYKCTKVFSGAHDKLHFEYQINELSLIWVYHAIDLSFVFSPLFFRSYINVIVCKVLQTLGFTCKTINNFNLLYYITHWCDLLLNMVQKSGHQVCIKIKKWIHRVQNQFLVFARTY